ncbi:NADH-quinone oxidoreductase subunit C/D [Roseinatronobacter bogoriensis]|uniref:NADH-quinone oxidoreductase subunit D n=1 Tax=Roseinatronobacter bogoriensis subsp. barguzinensis TaxID=441209 RepID=A0A2K8K5Y0_9RHOB|nr:MULTISPECIES: NADH-quinone oxidoreductase subunit C/D [Rhodobaca]ATX64844.1 NADH-quinone oxidoreductase subunit NuoC/D [Rhodobaca barguzinensis]MBB4208637.1 NADH-quinone oxidoreductase subunit C/D [Rhodobaca bogoriensis DSM 18756]TDW38095.1 NADH dehydrogenase subunit C /NADH dehydrogenase subunit D [Rhodobaca barguzinensis]TDY69735.1 NADH dehydrogenase subunit C /NADH dehydrogenase subunit D [Rhodobaca bogoriensis DSM 18756]
MTSAAPHVKAAPAADDPVASLRARFGDAIVTEQGTGEGFPVLWVTPEAWLRVHAHLRDTVPQPYTLLADLWGIDETARQHRGGQPASGVTLASHLISIERNSDIRLKCACDTDAPRAPTLTGVYPGADWYEREAWDMFGIRFDGRDSHRRILMPQDWQGHPLRKSHHARATEKDPFVMTRESFNATEAANQLDPEALGLPLQRDGVELMVLNFGPHHPSTHGVFRILLGLDGEEIVWAYPDIGYHHRGAEKMAERQTWHGFIPYTDRIDYLGGVISEMPYLLAVEQLCGIEVPARAQCIRVMLSEFFRITSHLLFYGTLAQDTGAMSPVFYMFVDRERAYKVIQAITGARMHPAFFRIGGVAMDLPAGWQGLVRDFLDWMPARLDDYERQAMNSELFRIRTQGVARYGVETCLKYSVTGPHLRAAGLAWDMRKLRPYSGYENYDFDVPTRTEGDCYARTWVRAQEMRESLKIIRQCLENMPTGPIKADHPLAFPPPRGNTLQDIETLIHHFSGTAYGTHVPVGEATGQVESARGFTQYSIISDGDGRSYRTRIRTPSFANLQPIAEVAPGMTVADFVIYLASIDHVMSDVDK